MLSHDGYVELNKQDTLIIQRANGFVSRFLGLMGRTSLEPGQGLLLYPCAAIHTAFMRFPLCVVFCDQHGQLLQWHRQLSPWRLIMHRQAKFVFEFSAHRWNEQSQLELFLRDFFMLNADLLNDSK